MITPPAWQLIESAPKDGEIIVGRWDQGFPTIWSDHWSEDTECWVDASPSFQPTHWLSGIDLSEPPQ